MNSKSLRRLAADHASLHNSGLPPNYLFPPDAATAPSDTLTSLDVILAGPQGTPYAAGAFRLHLEIPPTYPSAPPTAAFKTRIWHPNIDEATGAVCVETLKRDWRAELTLRDVLVTISCLLIQPNPDSALNAEAGRLLQEGDWSAFERRARLMTGIHAGVPGSLAGAVEEARRRGEEEVEGEGGNGKAAGNVNTERRKGATKGKRRGMAKGEVTATEEAENAAEKKMLATPVHELDTDPDSSWIPQPPAKRSRTLNLASDNIFGIRADAGNQGSEPGTAMDVDGSSLAEKQASETSFWDFAVPSQNSFLATKKNPEQRTQTDVRQPRTPLKPFQSIGSFISSPFASPSEDPFAFALCWLAYQKPPITPSGKGKGKARTRSSVSLEREEEEFKRLKAANFSIKKYNRGEGGPRKGLRRL